MKGEWITLRFQSTASDMLQSNKQCRNLLFHSVINSTPEDELMSRECMYLISHLSNVLLLNTGKKRGNATGPKSQF